MPATFYYLVRLRHVSVPLCCNLTEVKNMVTILNTRFVTHDGVDDDDDDADQRCERGAD